jgi:hypothetical protein
MIAPATRTVTTFSSADLMSQLSRGGSRTLPPGALARIGLGGIDLYCRSFVRPPQRIILDMDDIDDPSRNSPWCAVTATTAPNRAGVAASNVPRLHPRLRQAQPLPASGRHPWAHRRAFHHHQPSKGVARRSTRSVPAPRENLIEDIECLDPVPACSRWQANQLPAHRLEALAPAAATFETIRRTFVKIAVPVAELMVVIKLPSGRHACGDDGRDHDAGPRIDAAGAAASPHDDG